MSALPLRLDPPGRRALLAQFHARPEIGWFGFRGRFAGRRAELRITAAHDGQRGGAGGEAINGGVIAAAFDAAAALVAQAHHDGAVATLDLSIRFLRATPPSPALRFRAAAMATTRDLTAVAAELHGPDGLHATATALVKTLRATSRTSKLVA